MKKGKVIFLVILGLLVGGELFLRIFFDESLSAARRIRANPYIPDSVINYRFRPNSEYVHPVSGEIYSINKEGFIGKDFPEPDSQRYRIAIVGNSMISGDLKSPTPTNFCKELQFILDSLGHPVDILNFGIDGADRSEAELISVRHNVLKHSPDMILLQFVLPYQNDHRAREYYRDYRIAYQLGDTAEREMLMKTIDNYQSYRKLLHVLFQSHLIKAIFKLQEKHLFMPNPLGRYMELYATGQTASYTRHIQEYTWEESIGMVKELQTELQEKNITFFMFSIDKEDKKPSDLAKEHRFPLIPLNVSLTEEERFPRDSHPNPTGNRIIAERLYTLLNSNNLLLPAEK